MNYRVFLLLGSNQGDAARNLAIARQHIERKAGRIIAASSLYRSAAWGLEDQPDFVNQVLEIATQNNPEVLLDIILTIETDMGRRRVRKWGPRLIDIDLLFYGDKLFNSPALQLPHPGIPQRRFTLVPLAEIAADFVHPTLNKTVATLLDECADPLEVSRLEM